MGLFFKRKWLFFGLINTTNFAAAKAAGVCPLDQSNLDWRIIWNASNDTKFGFDYGINWGGKSYPAQFGVKTKINDDLDVKATAASNGDVRVGAKAEISKGFSMFFSTGFHASALGGKGEAKIGLGIKGKI